MPAVERLSPRSVAVAFVVAVSHGRFQASAEGLALATGVAADSLDLFGDLADIAVQWAGHQAAGIDVREVAREIQRAMGSGVYERRLLAAGP